MATLLAALAFVDGRADDAIHDALSEERPIRAPELDLAVVTAGDLGDAPRGWWRTARNGRVSVRELRGRPAVISFWSPDCEACRTEARALDRAAQEAGRNVLVLGVGATASSGSARDFIEGLGLSFPQVHDRTGHVARRWGVDRVPETFFVSPGGDVVGHVVGAASAAHVREGVAAAMTGQPAGLRTGGAREPLR